MLKDEIRALRKENDELKGSVAKLRKSNVQVDPELTFITCSIVLY